MAYLLVFLLGKQSPLFGNGSCGNQADSHALSVKQLEIHQLFYSMSDGVAKIEKGTLALFLRVTLYNASLDGTASADHYS